MDSRFRPWMLVNRKPRRPPIPSTGKDTTGRKMKLTSNNPFEALGSDMDGGKDGGRPQTSSLAKTEGKQYGG